MKKVIAITIVLSLALASVSMAANSTKGGSVGKGEGFKIQVPFFETKVLPGEIQTAKISLQRGDSFKQDVTLLIKTAEGISIDPAKVVVKAGDKPDIQLTITAPKDVALGDYIVTVTGTPATGDSTSVEFNVKVVASKADFTIKSDSPKGGSTIKGEGFKITVPTFATKVKQGEIKNISISLERGESFDQDVSLVIELTKGESITFDPANVLVKSGDKQDVQLTITAPKDAAIGEYVVTVTGTPTDGQPTSVEFTVKVVAL